MSLSSASRSAPNDELSPDFADFVGVLNANRVDCVLVGGYALGVHGVVRATADIDFLYRRTRSNVRRLCIALRDFGAPDNVIDETALLKPQTVTQFGRPPHRIDLLGDIDGLTFIQVWKGSTIVTVGKEKLRVIGREELLANKKAAGRTRDLDDIRRLESPGQRGTRKKGSS